MENNPRCISLEAKYSKTLFFVKALDSLGTLDNLSTLDSLGTLVWLGKLVTLESWGTLVISYYINICLCLYNNIYGVVCNNLLWYFGYHNSKDK